MLAETETDTINLPDLPDLPPMRDTRPRQILARSKKSGAAAQVNSGALLSFDASLPQQARDDISNSILFCQLAADKKFDRTTDPQDWKNSFASTLSIVGWIVQGISNTSSTSRDAVDWGELATSPMSSSAARLANEAIGACSDLPSGAEAILIWNEAAVGVASATFIIAASAASGNSVPLNLSICGFQTAAPDEGFLEWGLEYRIDQTYLGLTLNEAVYATVRQTIIDKLGDRPEYLVAEVELPRLASEG